MYAVIIPAAASQPGETEKVGDGGEEEAGAEEAKGDAGEAVQETAPTGTVQSSNLS